MQAVALVEYQVEQHGDAVLMAEVYELLVVVRRTVCLVRSEIEIGVVAPRIVAVELAYRHQLDGVDAQLFQIRQLLYGLTQRAVGI